MKNQRLILTLATLTILLAGCTPTPTESIRSVRKGNPAPVQGEAGLLESSKEIDRQAQAHWNETAARLVPQYQQLDDALNNAEWQNVLDLAQSIEAQWAASGISNTLFSQRAEAYIGLGHPEEAILLIDPDPKHRDTSTNLTLALALAMTDQLDAEGARAVADACIKHMSGLDPGFVPTPVTRNQKIAVVRTARAVDASNSGPDEYIMREAREALRLDPSQKLAAYALAQAASRQGLRTEARANYLIASTLPGIAGERARSMVKSIDHIRKQRDNPSTGVIPDGGPGGS